jgi:hypothetical protein
MVLRGCRTMLSPKVRLKAVLATPSEAGTPNEGRGTTSLVRSVRRQRLDSSPPSARGSRFRSRRGSGMTTTAATAPEGGAGMTAKGGGCWDSSAPLQECRQGLQDRRDRRMLPQLHLGALGGVFGCCRACAPCAPCGLPCRCCCSCVSCAISRHAVSLVLSVPPGAGCRKNHTLAGQAPVAPGGLRLSVSVRVHPWLNRS